MNRLNVEKQAAIIRALAEGNSVRATGRLTGTAKATVLKLLVELGEFCSIYQHHAHRNLASKRVEADEIWAFVGAKRRNAKQAGHGDCWTFTALDADSKLILSWLVGERSSENAHVFMKDVASRMAGRIQLTTDGLGYYTSAVESAFGYHGVDYAMLKKTYSHAGVHGGERGSSRYSPGVCTGAEKVPVLGDPQEDVISTSYVERSNLSLRMENRRFTRLTNAYSKKAENHAHAVSLYFMFYNYCRPHHTLTKAASGIKTTPAMASHLTDHVWSVEEILEKMDPSVLLQSK